MQKIVYSLAILGAIAFALSSTFYAVGQHTPALWTLCAGIFISALSVFMHWRDAMPTPKPEVSAPSVPEKPREQPRPRRAQPEEYEPNEREQQILWYLFQSNVDRELDSIVAGLRFQYSEEAVHHLENLAGHGYVRLPPRWGITDLSAQYRLTPKGREYVMKNLLP
jgi:hypothetical protein